MKPISELEASHILGISVNSSITELKQQFKKLAKKYHPDKGGDEHLFSVMSTAFKILYKRIKRTTEERDFSQLKKTFTDDVDTKNTEHIKADDKFINKFNKHFDENRLIDPVIDKGYDDFINEVDVVVHNDMNSKLVEYSEPIAQCSSKTLDFCELGKSSENDYSGKNDLFSKLHYMDYKKAHTTSQLVNPTNIIERKEYKSVDEIKKDRSTSNFEQTPEEEYYYERMRKMKESEEYDRIDNLKQSDKQIEIHHAKVKGFYVK
tara:strand:+ start:98 stop:886 length:789 start_codon:yes stop_codon:yes gene_type:complete